MNIIGLLFYFFVLLYLKIIREQRVRGNLAKNEKGGLMQSNDVYIPDSRDNELSLAIIKVVFWWPLQLILIIFDKTKDEFKPGIPLFLFVFIVLASGCNPWWYVPIYLMFGIIAFKNDFWK